MAWEGDQFRLADMRVKDGDLLVRLPRFFRDKAWANGIGSIQTSILTHTRNGHTGRLIFDFTECCWIDPLPLMSLLLEIFYARSADVRVEIRLPNPDDGPSPSEVGPYQGSPNRLLWFLNEEGFFACLDGLENDKDLIYPRPGSRKIYRSLRVTPSYEDARCIPLTLFSVPLDSGDGTFAQESVERLLRGVDTKLDAKIAPQTRERLTYKLRVVLQEARRCSRRWTSPPAK